MTPHTHDSERVEREVYVDRSDGAGGIVAAIIAAVAIILVGWMLFFNGSPDSDPIPGDTDVTVFNEGDEAPAGDTDADSSDTGTTDTGSTDTGATDDGG